MIRDITANSAGSGKHHEGGVKHFCHHAANHKQAAAEPVGMNCRTAEHLVIVTYQVWLARRYLIPI
jgi:hypothetical protein